MSISQEPERYKLNRRYHSDRGGARISMVWVPEFVPRPVKSSCPALIFVRSASSGPTSGDPDPEVTPKPCQSEAHRDACAAAALCMHAFDPACLPIHSTTHPHPHLHLHTLSRCCSPMLLACARCDLYLWLALVRVAPNRCTRMAVPY